MFNFRSTQQKDLENLELTETFAENTLYPGQNTVSLHMEIKSNLGWIAWKDREAALYTLLERAFSATKCDLKIDDNMETMGMEIEIPYDQEEKFMKSYKSKQLAREIDKIHGIEPSLCSWIDAKILNIRKTGGSTNPKEVGTSSIESIRRRIEMLEKCSETRTREVAGIQEMAISIKDEISKKFEALIHKIDSKVYEKCGSKFDAAEFRIMKVLKEELAFLATPSVFKHPPAGVESAESGARTFLYALNATVKPKPTYSPSLSIGTGIHQFSSLGRVVQSPAPASIKPETSHSHPELVTVPYAQLSYTEKYVEQDLRHEEGLGDKRPNSLPPHLKIDEISASREEFSF